MSPRENVLLRILYYGTLVPASVGLGRGAVMVFVSM